MVYINQSDYFRASKKNNVVSPRRGSHGGIATSIKVILPTQHKSSTHKCSHCERKDAKKYSISEKEVRWLCPVCIIKNSKKEDKEKPNFVKASKLSRRI